jgi:hypothetical protein
MVAWTVGLDEQIKALRMSGQTWEQVALELGLGRNTVLERGRRLGACKMPKPILRDVSEAADRPARPPGHPVTWGLITTGTVLDGAAYPYPVFL